MTTRDEAAIERMAAAIYWAGEHDYLGDPDPAPWEEAHSDAKDFVRFIARAAFAALLADPPPAVERAVLERLIAEQQRECARLRQDDPYFVPHIEARIDFLSDRLAELDAEETRDAR